MSAILIERPISDASCAMHVMPVFKLEVSSNALPLQPSYHIISGYLESQHHECCGFLSQTPYHTVSYQVVPITEHTP